MKTSTIKLYTLLLVGLLASNACTDKYDEMNENPNSPSSVNAQYLLTYSIEKAVDRTWGSSTRYERFNIDGPMCWMQYIGRNIYANEGDDYTIQLSMSGNTWRYLYTDALTNLNRIIEISKPEGKTPNANYEGIAIVLRSWVFSVLTDAYGAIPYKQALSGTAEIPVYSPAYDSQEDVYEGLLADLKTANQKLVATGGPAINAASDILYGGSILRWKQFANSLRLRLANRQAAKKPDESRAIMAEILGDPTTYPIFTGNADNARLVHTANRPSNNEWHETMVQGARTDWNVSKTLVDRLSAMNDTRLGVYAQPTTGTTYIGIPNGLPDAVATQYLSTTSKIGAAFLLATAPSYIMTYAELQFILAEAALDGDITTGTAAGYLSAGVTASFTQYGLTVPANYIANLGPVTKEVIMMQKWIALYGEGIESWTEYRRTGLPVLPAKDSRAVFVNDGVLPTRMPYPNSEQSLNEVEFKKGVTLNGGPNDAQTKMWWVE